MSELAEQSPAKLCRVLGPTLKRTNSVKHLTDFFTEIYMASKSAQCYVIFSFTFMLPMFQMTTTYLIVKTNLFGTDYCCVSSPTLCTLIQSTVETRHKFAFFIRVAS